MSGEPPISTLPGDYDSNDEAALSAELNRIEEALGKLYRERDKILPQLAELRGTYELPRPSRRTDKQMLIGFCPRCGDRLPSDGATKKVQR